MDGFSLLTNAWDFFDPKKKANYSSSTTGPQYDDNGNVSGVKAAPMATDGVKMMQNIGMLTTVMGAANQAIGGYFQAEAQRYQSKSAAVSLNYQADMAALNSRSAEYEAQSILESGKSAIFNQTLRAGQEKASTTARMAANGIRLGVGSAKEISASQDIVKDIDTYTINANATRAAAAARTQSTNYANQSLMDRTSAVNMNRSANSVSPFSAFTSSLMTSASSVAQQWNNTKRMRMYVASGGNF